MSRRQITYPFPMGDFLAYVQVPADITREEADRLAAMVRTLPFDPPDDSEPLVSAPGEDQ